MELALVPKPEMLYRGMYSLGSWSKSQLARSTLSIQASTSLRVCLPVMLVVNMVVMDLLGGLLRCASIKYIHAHVLRYCLPLCLTPLVL